MIWLKRLTPIILVVIIWLGYSLIGGWIRERNERHETRLALITARVWTATALYRDNPERFISYRDSVLQAEGISTQTLFEYLDRYRNHQEEFLSFTQQVRHFVDSLSAIEDSLLKAAPLLPADSTPVADSSGS